MHQALHDYLGVGTHQPGARAGDPASERLNLFRHQYDDGVPGPHRLINFIAQPRRDRRKVVRRAFLFCAFTLTATAGVAADLRGFVSEGGAGVLQFQFCNGTVLGRELFPIEDNTPNGSLRQGVGAVRQIMLRRYQPLYVEARGERGKTNATAYQFQRALGTVESCKAFPRDIQSNVRLLATGEAPAWRLVVTDASALLELPDKVSMKLPAAAFKPAGTEQTPKRRCRAHMRYRRPTALQSVWKSVPRCAPTADPKRLTARE